RGGAPARVIRRHVQAPGLEGVVHAGQAAGQRREMTADHVNHGVVFHPVDARGGVDRVGVVGGEKAVVIRRRDALRMKIWNEVSPKPKPSGRVSSASCPTRVSIISM